MANYYATCRANYFKVKNIKKFKEFCDVHELHFINGKTRTDKDLQDKVSFYVAGGDGNLPMGYSTENDYIYYENGENFMKVLSTHLQDNEVAIIMEAGSEKCRYVNGFAIAVNNKYEVKHISIDQIYDLASELGSNPITRAEY